eukprot:Pgem_evm1s16897
MSDLNTLDIYSLNHVIINGQTAKLRKILLSYSKSNPELMLKVSSTLIHLAVKENQTECLEMVLNDFENNINKEDEYGKTPLFYAIEQKDITCAKLLLEKPNLDPNAICYTELMQTPLIKSVVDNNIQLVQLLLQGEKMVDLTKKGYVFSKRGKRRLCNALQVAEMFSYKDIFSELKKYNYFEDLNITTATNVHARNSKNQTPLHAILTCNGIKEEIILEGVNLLLKQGADLYAQDCFKNIPIVYAIQHNYADVVQAFINAGYNVNGFKEKYEVLPIAEAIKFNSTSCLKKLLINGADPNCVFKCKMLRNKNVLPIQFAMSVLDV